MAAIDTATLNAPLALPGIGRALVSAGKLPPGRAEELYRKALADKTSFVSELTASGAVSPIDLVYVMSASFSAPLLDLDAVDLKRLPRELVDMKTCTQYRVLPLSKRGNRIMVAGLSSLLEPIIIVFLGGLIGGIVVSMYLPIFKLGAVV